MPLTKAKGAALQLDDDLASILTGLGLSLVGIEDVASNFTGADGEAALAELALRAPIKGVTAKSAAYTVVAADKEELFNCTSTFTLSLLAAATAGDGFTIAVANTGAGVITIDGDGAETINGAATLILAVGEWAVLASDGTNWVAMEHSADSATAGNWVQISQAVISDDVTVDFTDIDSTYDIYKVIFEKVIPADDGIDFRMRVGIGVTPTYQTGLVYLGSTTAYIVMSNTTGGIGNGPLEGLAGEVTIYNPSDTSLNTKTLVATIHNTATGSVSGLGADVNDYSIATAVTALRFYFSTGNLASGTITLYGTKK